MTVLGSMTRFLAAHRYLLVDPLAGARQLRKAPKGGDRQFRIPRLGLQAVMEAIAAMPEEAVDARRAKSRLRALMFVGVGLALRRSEIALARAGELQLDPDSGHWTWRGLRKGGRQGNVPVPLYVVRELARYRDAMDMPPYPQPGEETPLIMALTGPSPITGERIYQLVCEAFERGAERLATEAGSPERDESIRRLRQAAPHWLRHTRLSQMLEDGFTLAEVAEFADHASAQTTGKIYVHVGRRGFADRVAHQADPLTPAPMAD